MTLAEVLNDICESCYMHLEQIGIGTRENDVDGDQPLHKAVVQGNLEFVRVLLEAGSDPNSPGDMGCTPLHNAAIRGLVEIAQVLLEYGASPLSKNEFDRSPIESATDQRIKKLLLDSITKETGAHDAKPENQPPKNSGSQSSPAPP
ncbi:MAG: ankyrin repeat domain-containing protein [Verrucomicrobiaceae bacterium]|nr:ankyrin repeat domain-containing protein [Verrucomicrobiaceae bacterium]